MHFNPRSPLAKATAKDEETKEENGEVEESQNQEIYMEKNMKNNHIQTLRVKRGEAEVTVNKDGLRNQGSNVSTVRSLGTMKMNAERSRLNQARKKQISLKMVTLKRCFIHVRLLMSVRVQIYH